ncbi:MAG: FIST C-terminal domain-containing protein [Gracilibacteraceae bacterium]|jgi:hypothetical protein|nr:FIST C-terminal domain-containing protein [Gracilibacteraceae bacterium]
MIKMLTACTREIYFSESVWEDLRLQLDMERGLRRNSVGIVSCAAEFIDSGFVAAVCARLPFAVAGCTTLSCAARGESGDGLFTLAVLTSDEVRFSSAMTAPLREGDIEAPIAAACRRAEISPEKPALVLAFLPMLLSIGVPPMLTALNSVCRGAPVFGALSCDGTEDYRDSRVILDGVAEQSVAAFIMAWGDMTPQFFSGSVSYFEQVQSNYGVITDADNYTLKSVNNMSFLEYCASIGVPPDHFSDTGTLPLPFMVNYNDGSGSVARALYSITPEGHAIFAGEMPLGGRIAIYRLNYDGIVKTTEIFADSVKAARGSSALIFSCVMRNLLLGAKPDTEIEKILEILPADTSFLFAYAGGELCPLADESGALINRSHNFSLIACVF